MFTQGQIYVGIPKVIIRNIRSSEGAADDASSLQE
jgi:hypothetical protein